MAKTKKVNKLAQTINLNPIKNGTQKDNSAIVPRVLRKKAQSFKIKNSEHERHILHKAPRHDEGLAEIKTGGNKQLGINKGLYESPSAIAAKARPRKTRKKI